MTGANGQCGKAAYDFAKGAIGHHNSPPTMNGNPPHIDLPHGTAVSPMACGEQVIFSGITADQPGDDSGMYSIKGAPAGIQQAVEQEAEFWANLWKSSMEYKVQDIRPNANDRPKPITAAMIRSACKTFPVTTGLGADTLQPRALLRLSDNAVEALANIMNAAESNGTWPEFSQLVMTV